MKARVILLAAFSCLPAPAHAFCAFSDRLIGDADYAVSRVVENAEFIGYVRRGSDFVDGTGTRQTLHVLTALKGSPGPSIVLPPYIDSSGARLAGSSVQDTRLEVGEIEFFALHFDGATYQRSECLDIALSGPDADERVRRLGSLVLAWTAKAPSCE